MAGLSGLQARYDEQLRGTPGVRSSTRSASDGQGRASCSARTPGRAQPLQLTLDLGLQQAAERLLAGVGPASALVAIRPSTGEILAAANGPGSDGYNIATFGQYAPGSTFKIVSSLALLRAGLTPRRTVPCTRDDRRSTASSSRTTTTTRPAGSARSRCARRSPTPATPPSSPARAKARAAARWPTRPPRSGSGVDHDLGFPAYFGQVPAAGGRRPRPPPT